MIYKKNNRVYIKKDIPSNSLIQVIKGKKSFNETELRSKSEMIPYSCYIFKFDVDDLICDIKFHEDFNCKLFWSHSDEKMKLYSIKKIEKDQEILREKIDFFHNI